MFEILSLFHDTLLQIAFAQAQDNLSNPSLVVPPDLPAQVDNNSTGLQATIAGVAATGIGIVTKTLFDRRNNAKVTQVGSEIDKILLGDIIDNYNDFREYLNIEKQIQDLSILHQDYSYAKLLSLVYDVSTGETMGQRRAKYIVKINQYYQSYYQSTNLKTVDDLGKGSLEKTLNVVKDKTSPS